MTIISLDTKIDFSRGSIGINKKLTAKPELLDHNIDDINIFRKEVYKNGMIGIYTSWDNSIRNSIFDYYRIGKENILDTEFLQRFLKSVLEKSHDRDEFVKTVSTSRIEITRDVLCNTNNLSSDELIKLLERVGLRKENLYRFFEKSLSLIESIKSCDDLGVVVLSNPGRDEKFSKYIDDLVIRRNSIAHSYFVDDILNITQIEAYAKVFHNLSTSFIEYLNYELVSLRISHSDLVSDVIMDVTVIHKENTIGTSTAIIEVFSKINCKSFSNSIAYIVDEENKSFSRVIVHQLRNQKKIKVQNIVENNVYSIEVDCCINIKRERKYCIIADVPHNEKFEISVLI
ncbi:MAG: HEPN domain-containing protein [Erysipelotrichaceae bacterium]